MRMLPRRASVLLTASALAGGLFALSVVPGASPATAPGGFAVPAAHADAIDDSLKMLDDDMKSGDENKVTAKVTELTAAATLDPRVAKAVLDVAKSNKLENSSIAAIKALGAKKDPELYKYIKSKVKDDKLAESHKTKYVAIIDALGNYGGDPKTALLDKGTHGYLADDIVKKFVMIDEALLKAAVRSYASIRDKGVIEKLIEWTAAGDNPPRDNKVSAETKAKYATLSAACRQALQNLTQLDIPTGAAWKEFWDKNAKTFVIPDPNAAPVDPATLEAYTDPAYGYTIKRPPQPNWTFAEYKDTAGGRIILQNIDPQGIWMARVRIRVLQKWAGVEDTAGYVNYFAEEWKKNDFSQISKGPAIEVKKIGGRDFHVVTARGIGGGSWANWGSCERRIYVFAPVKGTFVEFEAIAGSVAEDPLKAAAWEAIEKMTFR